ncbi:MAG TPA: hypothetical protein VK939_04145, partial [Longimicrobiales bacterium]|nr:hypothetical protein [Longimicrobiales bacterium]
MARLPETGRIRSVQVHLVGTGAELDENAAAAEVYPSGRRAFGEGTGTRISIGSVDGLPTSLVLERPAYSNDQIYVAEHDGTVLITDFFGAALEWLPSGRRSVGDDQLVDLLLYRTVPGAGTLLEHVSRVGQGDRLEWRRGASWVRQVQQLDRPPEAPIPEWQVIGRLHDALAAATRERRPGVDANLFSGGVDSTLLQHYLGADVQAVTVTIDSPEFAPERTYAAAAR